MPAVTVSDPVNADILARAKLVDIPGHPNLQGFDYFYGYLGQVQAHNYYPDHLWENNSQVPLGGQYYSHDLMTEKVLWFIQTYKDRPFFLYIPYTIPHTKFQVPDLAQYADKVGWTIEQKTQAAMISRMDRDIGRIIDLLNGSVLEKSGNDRTAMKKLVSLHLRGSMV